MEFLYYSVTIFAGAYLWHNIFSPILLIIPFYFLKKRKLIIIFFIIGLAWGAYFNFPFFKFKKIIKKPVKIIGIISNIEKNKLYLKTEQINTISIKANIVFYNFKKKLDLNDKILLYAKLRIPEQYNPGTFNFKNYLLSKNIHFTGSLKSKKIKILKKGENHLSFFLNYKKYIKNKIFNLKIEPFYKGLLYAITTGDKSFINKESRDFLIKNGISHLFSISGLHVGTFFFVVLIIMRLLFYKLNNYYIPFLSSIPFVIFYVFFMGGNYPAIRAGFIIIFLIFSLFIKRYRDPYKILSFILLIITIINPYSLLNISLQYSFLIVYALIFYSQNLNRFNKVYNFFAIILIAFIAGIPISCYYFSTVHIKAILANTIAVPVFTFLVIPLTLFIIFSAWTPFIHLLYFIMKKTFLLLNLLPDLKPILVHSLNIFEIFLLYVIIFTFILLLAKLPEKNKKIIFNGIFSISFLSLIFIGYEKVSIKNNILGIINCGKCYSVFIKTEKKNILIGTGYSEKVFKRKILPVLLKKGIKKIDYLIIPMNYFALTGGMKKALELFKVRQIISNDKRICKRYCRSVKEGDNIDNLKVIYPPKNKYYLLNYKNSSIVLLLKDILITMFLTKDIKEYLSFKKIKFNYLITYEKIKKQRGYVEIDFSQKPYKIENFLTNQRNKSLIKIIGY